MKTSDIILKQGSVIVLFLVFTQAAYAQGSFHNLDFESAVIAPPPDNYTPAGAANPISAASALPYWTVREDTTVCTAVWGTSGLDVTFVSLDQGSTFGYHSALQGNYSVGLSGYNLAPGYYTSASISQVGLIPDGMQSIQFLLLNEDAPGFPFGGNFTVTLNGTIIPLYVLSTSGYVMTMAGDLSAFAGTTAELKFTAPSVSNFGLDSIVFSPVAIPEPSTFSLIALGLLGLVWHWWRKGRT